MNRCSSKVKPAKSCTLYLALAGPEASTACKMRASRSVVDDLTQFVVARVFRTGSQFGCELSLCGVAPEGARKRNFEARDSGTFAARRPALRGAETARKVDTYGLTRG